ncbi:MAG TPA: nickel-dependent lactate racemase [Candidatus Dormibacteraeota bacterium]|nr:nickel-dependent lactate racemase [Candidatus Dormibacteraeota bacterium]
MAALLILSLMSRLTSKRVRLAYGRNGLEVEVPADADVLEPQRLVGVQDEAGTIRQALRDPIASEPLRELVPRGATVGISICDVTRPFPASRVLPVLLGELEHLDPARVTVFVATGTHRPCTAQELLQMLGEEVQRRARVVQHDAFDRGRHAELGLVPGTDVPVLLERDFLEHDVRLTTGFIEPHFFAGFSGGPKMIAPGLAHLATVLELHSAARIGHPKATWGVTQGNPIHDAVRGIAERVGVTFNLDVTLNQDRRITRVFAGDLACSHAAGCAFAMTTAMVPVLKPYDVVVSTNSGYPLDQNLYQTVKGMSAAAQIVRHGGAIVMASECSDGLPDHGRYKELLRQAGGPAEFLGWLERPGHAEHDQWQVQVQALIQRRARVVIHAGGLTPDQVRAAWLEPVDDVSDCVAELLSTAGPGARVAVLPHGPQTIPYLSPGG